VSDSRSCTFAQAGSAVITVYQPLSATIQSVSSVCKDSTFRILFTGIGGVAPYIFRYNVDGGNVQSVTTLVGDTVSIAVSTSVSGIFTYNLVSVSDSRTCTYPQSEHLSVEVLDCFVSIIIPNAFTPNGDGVNDTFGAVTSGIQTLAMTLKDRFGRLIYTIDSPDGRWDGNLASGTAAPVGVYFYNVDALGIDNQNYTRSGSVSLYREFVEAAIRISPNLVGNSAMVELSGVSTGLKTISISNPGGKEVMNMRTTDDSFDLNVSHLTKEFIS
jgi:gliding motility-associated-like protein